MIKSYPKAYKSIYYIISEFKKNFKRDPMRTEILKLLYLADLDYYKKCGEKYTELDYIFYKRGPWTEVFHHILDDMKGKEIWESKLKRVNGEDFYLYGLTGKTPRSETEIESDVKTILDNYLFIFRESQLIHLLEFVYQEEPMASTKQGDPIDFSRATLNVRDERERYRQKRRRQLEKGVGLKNDMVEDDLELFNEFKPLRDRANKTL